MGGLVIGVSLTLEFVVEWIQKRRNVGISQRLEWTTNDTLQLQRLAHEELGFGTRSRTAQGHPVTAPGEQLAPLDISDPNHPKLASFGAKLEPSAPDSTGEMAEQGASTTSPNHAATTSGSGSTTPDLISPASGSQALHIPNTRPIDESAQLLYQLSNR
ncbi:MAG: hypothetical protein M1816_008020 [Peltula sp. TS41687]|nr:MAG: hypothetical protein M1816_008020 [Peltula sp. TS41687]